jgi:hypothetical protein
MTDEQTRLGIELPSAPRTLRELPPRVESLSAMIGKTIAAVIGDRSADDDHHGYLIAFTDGSFASGSISVNSLSQLGETDRLVAAGLLTAAEGAAILKAEERERDFRAELRERDELRRLLAKYGTPDGDAASEPS